MHNRNLVQRYCCEFNFKVWLSFPHRPPINTLKQVELKKLFKAWRRLEAGAGLGQKLGEAGQGSVSHGGPWGNTGWRDSFVVAEREREQPWAELQKKHSQDQNIL